ncbi:MAG: hypothetical protein QNJ13_17005 [Paracoccaceae bacterium]|nr:hypothetical protein [Paracoccaceae bacterium]
MPELDDVDASLTDRLAERVVLKALAATDDKDLAQRRRILGAVMRWLAAPLFGWPGMVRRNLALVRPDLPRRVRWRLARAAGTNAGLSLAELFSPDAFRKALLHTPVAGPGVEALKDARLDGRGVALITAEIGNPDALVLALAGRGLAAAALAADAPRGALACRIETARRTLGGLRFPDTEAGRAALEAHLGAGGLAVLQGDRLTDTGAPVLLFGARVRTPVFAASAALRQHAELIPAFALRRRDGRFGVWLAAPVVHGRPGEMMQAYQGAVEEAASEFMEQFFWAEARWRPERYRPLAAPGARV